MVLRVRCLLCSKILECQRNDTTCLLDHINLEHPNVTLSRISNKFDETDLPLLESQTSATMSENVGIKSPSNESLQEVFHSAETVNQNLDNISEKKKSNFSRISNNNNKNNCYIDCECQLNKKHSVTSKLSTIPETESTASSKYQSNYNNNNNNNSKKFNSSVQAHTDAELQEFIKSIIAKESANIKSCTCCYMENGNSSPNGRLTSHDKMEEKIISNDSETKVLYKRKYKPMKPIKFGKNNKRKLYKTSVEKWRPGSSKITCPECGVTRRPVIRSHADRVSHSSFGAALILTCWPLCFLPCLFPPPTTEYLHCSQCNHFLGQYNHKSNKVQPNEESLGELPNCSESCEGCKQFKSDNDSLQAESQFKSE